MSRTGLRHRGPAGKEPVPGGLNLSYLAPPVYGGAAFLAIDRPTLA
jgi:hypothetical protein